MTTNMDANETTIYYIQEDALEGSGYMIAQPELSSNEAGYEQPSDQPPNGSLLLPEHLNSTLGTGFVIKCTPCDKIFTSAEGYNQHVQVLNCVNINKAYVIILPLTVYFML